MPSPDPTTIIPIPNRDASILRSTPSLTRTTEPKSTTTPGAGRDDFTAALAADRAWRKAVWRDTALAWVWTSSSSRGPARAALTVLAMSMGHEGDVVLGYGEIANRAGVSTSTAQEAVKRLVAAGELVCIEAGGQGRGGRNHANRYRMPAVHIAPPTGMFAEHDHYAEIHKLPTPGSDDQATRPSKSPGAGDLGTHNVPGAGNPNGSGLGSPSNPSPSTPTVSFPLAKEIELTHRLASVCVPDTPISDMKLRATCRVAVVKMLRYLDWHVVDEIIGYMATLAKPARGPSYALTLVNNWSADRGWQIPEELRMDRP